MAEGNKGYHKGTRRIFNHEGFLIKALYFIKIIFLCLSLNGIHSLKILIRTSRGRLGDFLLIKFLFIMKNLNFSAMTPEVLATCKTKISELEAMLPENPILSANERLRMAKISYSGQNFVREAISLSKDMPDLKSSFVDLDQMEGTLNFHQQVNELLTGILGVQHWVEDLRIVSGSSVDSAARACYKNIKTAADHQVESAAMAYDRLKGRYARKRSAPPETVNGGD